MSRKKKTPLIEFNNATLNEQMIQNVIETTISPNDQQSIIKCEALIQSMLQNYLISDKPTKPPKNHPDTTQWHQQLIAHLATHPINITHTGRQALHDILSSLTTLETIHKKVTTTKKNFHQKLTTEIASENTAIWNNMMAWIDTKLTPFINSKDIPNNILQTKTNDWVTETKKNLETLLESAIKDVLHSLVNQSIILSKITSANGWKEKIATQETKDNQLIQAIEKEIKEDLTKITKNYAAPFMTSFSNELFTRCYKQLLSPKKDDKSNTRISELTGDLTSKTIPQYQWPKDIQEKFDNEYLEFLKSICNNKPNIKKYAKDNFKSLKAIANNKTLTDKEKKEIQRTYFKIYKLTRKYEKLITVLEEKKATPTSTAPLIKTLCQNIELSHHGFRPFLTALIQQFQLCLQEDNNKARKKSLINYTKFLKVLQGTTKTLALSQLINQHIEKHPSIESINHNDTIKSTLASKDNILTMSIEPWKHHEWTPLLNQIIEVLGIKERPQQHQRIINNPNKSAHHISTIIEKDPSIEQNGITERSLNNQA